MISENTPIIEAKLRMPAGGNMLFRERLVRKLLDRDAGVIAVNAPAGYGKTVLLSQWAGSAGIPIIWYKLDEADNSPVVFFNYLFTGISRQLKQPHYPLQEKGPHGGAEFINGLTALISREIDKLQSDKIGVVFDDFHCLNSMGCAGFYGQFA